MLLTPSRSPRAQIPAVVTASHRKLLCRAQTARSGSITDHHTSHSRIGVAPQGCACVDPLKPKKHGPFISSATAIKVKARPGSYARAMWPRSGRNSPPTSASDG